MIFLGFSRESLVRFCTFFRCFYALWAFLNIQNFLGHVRLNSTCFFHCKSFVFLSLWSSQNVGNCDKMCRKGCLSTINAFHMSNRRLAAGFVLTEFIWRHFGRLQKICLLFFSCIIPILISF